MTLFTCLLLIVCMALPAGAQGQKPPPHKNHSALKDAKEKANDALDALDRGVHQAAKELKSGANQALQSLDNAIHDRKK